MSVAVNRSSVSPISETELTLNELIGAARRSRRRIATAVTVGAIAGLVTGFFAPTQFTVASSFTPQGRASGGAMGGLAAQLGVAVSTPASQTPQFYAELVRSRELLRRTATARAYGDSTSPVSLAAALSLTAPDSASLTWKSIRWLDKHVVAVAANRTGIVTLRTTAPTGAIAAQLNTELLGLINAFNLETRQTQASAERKFAEQRMTELRAELKQAEDAYQEFLERNRAGLSAPEVAFPRGRHERAVALRQQVYSSMVESHEQARLDEVRDTPVITVIDPPRSPLTPDGKRWSLRVLIGAGLGFAVALAMSWASVSMRAASPAALHSDTT